MASSMGMLNTMQKNMYITPIPRSVVVRYAMIPSAIIPDQIADGIMIVSVMNPA